MGRVPAPDPSEDARFWTAVHAFRVAATVYAAALLAVAADSYRHPRIAWAVLALLAVWSAVVVRRVGLRPGPVRGIRWILVADVTVAAAAVLTTRLLDDPGRIADGAPTLPSIWPAAAVLAWAVWKGWRGGLAAATVIALADVVEVGRLTTQTVNNIVLLVMVGVIVGVGVELVRAGRAEMAAAIAVRAATQERERLARDIHDSVLQVLGLLSRRGRDGGADPAEMGRLAGEQEARLRALVSTGPAAPARSAPDGPGDLRAVLARLARPGVTVSGPAHDVLAPAPVVRELAAATAAALDNVEQHAGPAAQAWVLLEEEGPVVTVTVRDDGVGFAAGRLQEARREGRLGVQASIRRRVEDLGGTVRVSGTPGAGTVVELRVDRAAAAGPPAPAGTAHRPDPQVRAGQA